MDNSSVEQLYEEIMKYTEYKERSPNISRYFRETLDYKLDIIKVEDLLQLVKYLPNLNSESNLRLLDFVAIKGDFESMEKITLKLFDYKEDIRLYINNALLQASRYTFNLTMVKILISERWGEADIDCTDKNSNTPLHWAVYGAACDIIRYLVYKGANVDATNKNNETPLHWAAFHYNENKKVKFVDSEIEFWYNKLKTVGIKKKLYLAIALNLINDAFVNIDITSIMGEKALSIIKSGILSSTNYNESQKAFILNAIEPYRALTEKNIKTTSLLNACKDVNLLQVEYLLKSKVPLNLQDEEGYTGLHWLIESYNYHRNTNKRKQLKWKQVMNEYISLVDIHYLTDLIENKRNNSVFLQAVKFGNEDIVNTILIKCGNGILDQKDGVGYSAIHIASVNGHVNVVKILVENKDDVNKTDGTGNGDTPLHLAVFESNCNVIEFLIKSGANVNKTDKFGVTPVALAIDYWDVNDKETKIPDQSSQIGFWYKQLKEIGFINRIHLAVTCYFINDCKAQLYIPYTNTVSDNSLEKLCKYIGDDFKSKTLEKVTDLLKYKINEDKVVNLNQTQIEFLHRFIICADRSSEIVYKNLSEPRGYCIIVNNFDVIGEDARLGSEKDIQKLDKLFKDLNFCVKLERNLESEKMLDRFSDGYSQRPELKDHDALVVIVMSHGGAEFIKGSDGMPVNIRQLIDMFNNENCPNLKGKPKIFIFQSCRGTNLKHGLETDNYDSETSTESDGGVNEYTLHVKRVLIPQTTDVLVCYATLYGQVAYRPETGAWYCDALYDVLSQNHNNSDILSILSSVDKQVQQKTLNGKYKQTTAYENNGFNKKFFFNVFKN